MNLDRLPLWALGYVSNLLQILIPLLAFSCNLSQWIHTCHIRAYFFDLLFLASILYLLFMGQIGFCKIISTHTSHAGRDALRQMTNYLQQYFYSHVPCGTWLKAIRFIYNRIMISTHTSHAGRDCVVTYTGKFYEFLLTRPMRDVTRRLSSNLTGCFYFYSHVPCGTWHIFLLSL